MANFCLYNAYAMSTHSSQMRSLKFLAVINQLFKIFSRLIELLDPSKHRHPGIPYDFYSGYVLMVSNNVDNDINEVNTDTFGGDQYNNGNVSPPTVTYLYGRFPNDVISDFRRSYGSFERVGHNFLQIPLLKTHFEIPLLI